MKKNEILRIKKLTGMIYKSEVNNEYIIKELMAMFSKENDEEVVVENTLGRAYYEMKEYTESIYYYKKALRKKTNNLPSYLGLFKNNVQLENVKKALFYLQLYQAYSKRENVILDISLLETMLQNITSSVFKEANHTSFYLQKDLKEDPIFPLYSRFIDEYNQQNYSECLLLAEKLMLENKRIFLDFTILKKLIELELKKAKRMALEEAYQKLEIAYQEQDYKSMASLLEIICKYPLKKRDFIFHTLYVLATKGFTEQVRQDLFSIPLVLKEEKPYIQVIQNTIQNQEAYRELTKEQQELYISSIENGRMEYQKENMEKAYEIYQSAYVETKQPIFLYYMGKMLHKMKHYEEAEEMFIKYSKCGDVKLGKAYLYLSGIAYNNKNRKKFVLYGRMGNVIEKLYQNDFRILGVDEIMENTDLLKLRIQRKEMHIPKFKKI